MKLKTLLTICILALCAFVLVHGQDVSIKSVTLMPGSPVVVPGCSVPNAGGYLRYSKGKNEVWYGFSPGGYWTDEEYYPSEERIGKWLKDQLAAGRIVTAYPDKNGTFVTVQCQTERSSK